MLKENSELHKGRLGGVSRDPIFGNIYCYNQTTGYSLWASLNNEHFVTDVTDDVAEPSADETVETDKCEQIDF